MDTSVSTGDVATVIAKANGVHREFNLSMAKVIQFKNKVPTFWQGAEANKMMANLDDLVKKIGEFNQQYSVFMESLNKLSGTYDLEQSNLIGAMVGVNNGN